MGYNSVADNIGLSSFV